MIDSYWDLYVTYIDHCVRYNCENDIDPAHYQMEWNHFLPKSIFGDWPIGQYLLLKQHAIASALQTLAFKRNCLCAWHKQYLSSELVALSWDYYREMCREVSKKTHEDKTEDGKSRHSLKMLEKQHQSRDENGKSHHSLKLHESKDEEGRSLLALKAFENLHKDKTEEGKSAHAVKAGSVRSEKKKNGAEKFHEAKDEEGKSLGAVKNGLSTTSQVWESTIDGYRSNVLSVARHNKLRGWDPAARVRIS